MPPQQPDRLLDLFDDVLDFRAHVHCSIRFVRLDSLPIVRRQGDHMREQLIGTWKLVSVLNEDAATGERSPLFGDDPVGYINYAPDGRMMVIQVRGDRQKPAGPVPTADEAAALFRSVLSYAGTYTIDGNEVTHHVDISWNETWTGTTQTRTFRFEGDRLHLSLPPSPNPVDGRMSVRSIVWQKVM
jgi:lipocalin-like protein